MNPNFDQPGPPRRWHFALWVVAGVAAAGALALPFAWWQAGHGWDSRLQSAGLLLAAPGYLLATAQFYVRLARWRPGEEARQTGLRSGLAGDLIIGSLAAVLLTSGHTTQLYRDGLWLAPPILLTACAISAVAQLLLLSDGRNRVSPPNGDRPATGPRYLLRLVLTAVLALLLLASL